MFDIINKFNKNKKLMLMAKWLVVILVTLAMVLTLILPIFAV